MRELRYFGVAFKCSIRWVRLNHILLLIETLFIVVDDIWQTTVFSLCIEIQLAIGNLFHQSALLVNGTMSHPFKSTAIKLISFSSLFDYSLFLKWSHGVNAAMDIFSSSEHQFTQKNNVFLVRKMFDFLRQWSIPPKKTHQLIRQLGRPLLLEVTD